MNDAACDYLLLTTSDDETEALHALLRVVSSGGPERVRSRSAPTMFAWALPHRLGLLRVFTASLYGMGNEAVYDVISSIVRAAAARFVGLVGIAAAATDGVEPGTVMIADRVWHYEPSKVRDDGEEHRGIVHLAGRLLLDRLRHIDVDLLEAKFPQLGPWSVPRVGTFASGSKVIASRERRDELRAARQNVIGLEMEGHALADVVGSRLGNDHWFMVRSVSDTADSGKSDHHRKLACRKAAAFSIAFLLDSDLLIPGEAAAGAEEPGSARALGDQRPQLAGLAGGLASKLLEIAPAALVEVLRGHSDLPGLMRSQLAEAHWKLGDHESCLRGTQPFVDSLLSRNEALDEEGAALVRLYCWSLWRGQPGSDAFAILETTFGRVSEARERARWADLMGTIERHRPNGDFLMAIGYYQQALALKKGSDDFGYAVTLQNVAFTYVEAADIGHADAYFERLVQHAKVSSYSESAVSEVYGHEGRAWLALLESRVPDHGVSSRLKQIGALIKRHVVPVDLRLVARSLSYLADVRRGRSREAPRRIQESFWARLVYGHARVVRGDDEALVWAELFEGRDDLLLAPHCIQPLLRLARPDKEPSLRPRRVPAPHAPWPVSVWMAYDAGSAMEAIQFMESIAGLYAIIVESISSSAVAEEKRQRSMVGMGAAANYLRHWASRHPQHPLSIEVNNVASIVRDASSLRNAYVHGAPGEGSDGIASSITRAASAVAREARLLAASAWVSKSPPALSVAGETVRLDGAFSSTSDGRLTLTLGRQLIVE